MWAAIAGWTGGTTPRPTSGIGSYRMLATSNRRSGGGGTAHLCSGGAAPVKSGLMAKTSRSSGSSLGEVVRAPLHGGLHSTCPTPPAELPWATGGGEKGPVENALGAFAALVAGTPPSPPGPKCLLGGRDDDERDEAWQSGVQAPPIPEQPERPRRGRPPTREGSEASWVREHRSSSAPADDWIPAAAGYEAWEAGDPEVRAWDRHVTPRSSARAAPVMPDEVESAWTHGATAESSVPHAAPATQPRGPATRARGLGKGFLPG